MKKLCSKIIKTLANWTEQCSAKSEQTTQEAILTLAKLKYFMSYNKVALLTSNEETFWA